MIEDCCRSHGVEFVGCIPFDEAVTRAMVQGQPVTAQAPVAPAGRALTAVWERVRGLLDRQGGPVRSDGRAPVRT